MSLATSKPVAGSPGMDAAIRDAGRFGWTYRGVLVVCVMAGLACSVSATLLASFPIFIRPLAQTFGWSRGALSLAFSVAGLAITIGSPIAGRFVARYGTVRVLRIAVIAFAASVAALAATPASYPAFLALMFVAGLMGAACNTFVYLSLLPGWFPQRLGLMLGLVMTGIGLGQSAMQILAQYCVDLFGWRGAYIALGTLSLAVTLPCAAFVLREPPSTRVAAMQHASLPESKDAQQALRSAAFWFFCCGFFVVAVVASGCALHTVPILVDRGIQPMHAAALASTAGIAVLIARFVGGYLLDLVGPRIVGVGAFVAAAMAPLVLVYAGSSRLVVLAPMLVGMAIGIEGDLMPMVVRRYFGLGHYGLIYSWMFTAYSFGVVVGPLAMGLTFDHLGSYQPALFVMTVVAAVATLCFWFAADLQARPVQPVVAAR